MIEQKLTKRRWDCVVDDVVILVVDSGVSKFEEK